MKRGWNKLQRRSRKRSEKWSALFKGKPEIYDNIIWFFICYPCYNYFGVLLYLWKLTIEKKIETIYKI